MSDDIKYIKQLKSRYNEIQYHKDNVVTIQFTTRPDGLKGFSFLSYESEDELIKHVDKDTKADEEREIINLIKHFGFTGAKIAEELKPKYAPDVEMNTYKERIKKRIQRLREKGRIETNTKSSSTKSNTSIETGKSNQEKKLPPLTTKPPTTSPINNGDNNKKQLMVKETLAERTDRILKEAGITNYKDKYKKEAEQDWKDLQTELLILEENPIQITDNDIP